MADWRWTCNCCGKEETSLRRCGRCYKVYYCSNECQTADWVRHKVLCSKRVVTVDNPDISPKRHSKSSESSSGSDEHFSDAKASMGGSLANKEHASFSDEVIDEEEDDDVYGSEGDNIANVDKSSKNNNKAGRGSQEMESSHSDTEWFDAVDGKTNGENLNGHSSESGDRVSGQTADGNPKQREIGDKVDGKKGKEHVNNDKAGVRAADESRKETTSTASGSNGKIDNDKGNDELADKRAGNKDKTGKVGTENEEGAYRTGGTDDAKRDVSGTANTPGTGKCGSCPKTGCTMRCAKCKDAFYCSKMCQKQAWPFHKKTCNKQQPTGAKSRAAPPPKPNKSGDSLNPLFTKLLNMGVLPPAVANREATRPMGSLEKAKVYAKWKISDTWTRRLKIVDDLNDVPWEHDYTGNRRIGFVAFIFKYSPIQIRHGVFIKDNDNEVTRVEFYLDHDDPRGFFSFSHLQPGNYLCLESPAMHAFLDGNVGIRIDDPAQVHVIPINRLR